MAILFFVGVIPAYRNQGLLRQMLYSICQAIQDRGQRVALLSVESKNLAAIKSYLNAGFLPRLVSADKRISKKHNLSHVEAPAKQAREWKRIFKKLKMKPIAYSSDALHRMDYPHPLRPWLLDLREQGYEVR